MAIYHFAGKIISRGNKTFINVDGSKGKTVTSRASSVASAAYRAGEKLIDELKNLTFDYTRKSGIVYSQILLPKNAPPKYLNRQILWNAVEKIEKQKNSQLAREFNIALPIELTANESIKLVRDYVYKNFVRRGMCADFAIHNPKHGAANPHVHIMLTMRPLDEHGKWGMKAKKEWILDSNENHIFDENGRWKFEKIDLTNGWNNKETFHQWRENWAKECNLALEKAGRSERIDHRSYKEQGIDQQPTKHMGKHETALERKGIKTEKGNYNRHILSENMKRAKALVKAEIEKIMVDIPTVSEVLKKSVEIKSPNINEIPTGEVIQRRTYTPSSGVVREGDPSTPKLHDISPVNGENHVLPLWQRKEKSADTLPFKKEKRSTLNSATFQKVSSGKRYTPDMENRLKIYIRRQETLEHIQSTARLLSFIKNNNIKSHSDMTEKINSMEKALNALQGDVERCDGIKNNLDSLRQAAITCQQNYSVAETYSNKKFFKAAYYKSHKFEIDNFINAQRLLLKTGRYDETTKPEEIEEIIEAATSKRDALVNTLRDQKNDIIIFKIRKTEMEQLLGIDKKPLTKERSKALEYRIEEIERQQTPQRDKDNRNERGER